MTHLYAVQGSIKNSLHLPSVLGEDLLRLYLFLLAMVEFQIKGLYLLGYSCSAS